jgi:hypothetical protein
LQLKDEIHEGIRLRIIYCSTGSPFGTCRVVVFSTMAIHVLPTTPQPIYFRRARHFQGCRSRYMSCGTDKKLPVSSKLSVNSWFRIPDQVSKTLSYVRPMHTNVIDITPSCQSRHLLKISNSVLRMNSSKNMCYIPRYGRPISSSRCRNGGTKVAQRAIDIVQYVAK